MTSKLIGFIFILLIACKNKAPVVELNYCQMLADDQNLNDVARKMAFRKNFNSIIEYTKNNGFPNFDFNALPMDSCKT